MFNWKLKITKESLTNELQDYANDSFSGFDGSDW